MKRLRRIRGKQTPTALKRVAREITMPGEFGRAIPGENREQQKADLRDALVADIPAGKSKHTEIQNYFTRPTGERLLYSAEGWVKIRLTLQTAGPVVVSTRQNVIPVFSGKGAQLVTNQEQEFPLTKGDRLYIAAEAVNRVMFIVEPIPWQEQIALMQSSILRTLRQG